MATQASIPNIKTQDKEIEHALNSILLTLLEKLRNTEEQYLIPFYETYEWPDGALDKLVDLGILTPGPEIDFLPCPSCGIEHIIMTDPSIVEDRELTDAFISCSNPVMENLRVDAPTWIASDADHNQAHVIRIPCKKLHLWQITPFQLAQVVAKLLDGVTFTEDIPDNSHITILYHRRSISLHRNYLKLICNPIDAPIPLNEFLYFEGVTLSFDRERLIHQTKEEPDQFTRVKESAQPTATQKLHKKWQEQYEYKIKQYPHKTQQEIAEEISKDSTLNPKEVAPETIQKILRRETKTPKNA